MTDGAEIAQDSDPADATDEGKPNSRTPVSFYFGDHSTSHSEKYLLTVVPIAGSGTGTPPRAFSWVNTPGKSEIRMVKTRQQLVSLGLLPANNDDGTNEMAWYDIGDDNASSDSNLSDSRAFSRIGYQFRGRILKPSLGDLNSSPPVSINSESFYKSAGC